MKTRYLIRLDDACPTMDGAKWQRMFDMLDRYGVKPMVGIIPCNEDSKQVIDESDPEFWQKAQEWQRKGYAIALHGYTHCYISDSGMSGLNPMWSRSEFAGVALDIQRQKIKDGFKILLEHGLHPKYFFAPSHTFDENTLMALRDETDIRIISDTIGRYPYKKSDFIFIPQIIGHCEKVPLQGIYTFCLHPSAMTDASFSACESFFKRYNGLFINFGSLDLNDLNEKSAVDIILSKLFFSIRSLRGLR